MSTTPDTPAPPKRRRKLPLIIAAAALLAAAGGGAFWWLKPQHAEAAGGAVEKTHDAVVKLEPFLVNLADAQASRFLRASISLVVDAEHGESLAHEGKESVELTKARSAILELLAEQTAEALVTAAGKAALKAAITKTASAVLAPVKVHDVLFTDFVVQF